MADQQRQIHPSPLRYPGGKGSLTNFMKLVVSYNNLFDGHYVEVYAGGAAIAWRLLFDEYVQQVHINDVSKPLIAFWLAVRDHTEELCRLIWDTPVTIEEWHRQQKIQRDANNYSRLELGFSTFFLNRTNRSGILNGGVIGGKNQGGQWKLDARFNKEGLVQRIQQIARYKNRIKVYNRDAADFIQTVLPTLPNKTLVYLDPPYFKKGQELYQNHYTSKDHAAIANLVKGIAQPWLVSYDSCPPIEELYAEHNAIRYNINYSAQERYAGAEVIFLSEKLEMPEVADPTAVKFPAYAKLLI